MQSLGCAWGPVLVLRVASNRPKPSGPPANLQDPSPNPSLVVVPAAAAAAAAAVVVVVVVVVVVILLFLLLFLSYLAAL